MKKIPQRSCVICRQKKDKSELIRIVKNKENIVSMDKTGKKEGRGAYICNNIECLEKAIKTKTLKKILDIDIDEEIYENIRESINRG
ncbi:MAG: YlxR family protein [Clostridia bacterium]|jgi:predicted RNA-binding protein YlxR (DUF448 family)|nr:YlxR family protein [Clostridia bacterium]